MLLQLFESGDPNCVSVIIPCYKDGDTVGAAVESVASAAHYLHSAVANTTTSLASPAVEILLVDDKSPDRQCEVAFWQVLAKTDPAVAASVASKKDLDELQVSAFLPVEKQEMSSANREKPARVQGTRAFSKGDKLLPISSPCSSSLGVAGGPT